MQLYFTYLAMHNPCKLLLCIIINSCYYFTIYTGSSVTCNDGDIRLVNGSTEYDGLLEVCYLNQWGTICGDFFGDLDAQVACRQLGLNTDQASAQLSFGYGLFILLANVQCRGGEDRLVDCVHSGFGDNRCFHFADAGIICPPAASKMLTCS